MNNITLSADKELIETARKTFKQRGTTINSEFRKWLASQTENEGKRRRQEYEQMMKTMPSLNIGRRLTRDEMNER